MQGSVKPWVVVPCMGRLAHLRETLPAIIRNTPFGVMLVDYSCPERCGHWAEEGFPEHAAGGRLRVWRVAGETWFHKTRALNLGARAAMDAGASHLCFVDADTRVLPGFGLWVVEALDDMSIFISALTEDGRDVAELYGLLLTSAELFERSGGYAEVFKGWGCEDLEMRLRLALQHGANVREVPLRYLAYIQHAFALRTVQYRTKDWSVSNSRNLAELNRRVLEWTGKSLSGLEQGLTRRLVMQRHPVIYVEGRRLRHFAVPEELLQPDDVS